jgi:alpha-tubulin suppressor-like RCC1 family protein
MGHAMSWNDKNVIDRVNQEFANQGSSARFRVRDRVEKPKPGDIAVFEPKDPSNPNDVGHVAFVEKYNPADNSVNVAEYNKGKFAGLFSIRGSQLDPNAQLIGPKGDHTNRTEIVRADSYIAVNDAAQNNPSFKLKLYAQGTRPPQSPAEIQTIEAQAAARAKAQAYNKLFEGVKDDAVIRAQNGAWYVRKGKTLQWVVTGDAAAKAIGLDKKRTNKTTQYTEEMVHSKEEGYTYPYTQRDKDATAKQLGIPTKALSVANIAAAAKKLGFDGTTKQVTTEGAKCWRFTKAGKQYAVNMDLVAMLVTGKKDVFAYPKNWKDGKSWQAYPLQAKQLNYFALPLIDFTLANYISVDDVPGYMARLEYLQQEQASEGCITPGALCIWGKGWSYDKAYGNPAGNVRLHEMPGLHDVIDYSLTGMTGMVLQKDGTVLAWPTYEYVNNKQVFHDEPYVMGGFEGAKKLTWSGDTYFVLNRDGSVTSGGGTGSLEERGNPRAGERGVYTTPVICLANIASVVAPRSANYDLAVDANGAVYSWGVNSRMLARDYEREASCINTYTGAIPGVVKGLPKVVSVAGHADTAYAVAEDGKVYSWGSNTDAKLGYPTDITINYEAVDRPRLIPGLPAIREVVAIGGTTYAITKTGDVYAWGQGGTGQLGDNRIGGDIDPVDGICRRSHRSITPKLIAGLSNVVAISTDFASSPAVLATLKDGSTYAWGSNEMAGFGFGNGIIDTKPEGCKRQYDILPVGVTGIPTKIYALGGLTILSGQSAGIVK